MGYCLACGMSRDTSGGLCKQCADDRRAKLDMEAKYNHAQVMRIVKRGKRNGGDKT